jgi:hypothetical protein
MMQVQEQGAGADGSRCRRRMQVQALLRDRALVLRVEQFSTGSVATGAASTIIVLRSLRSRY